jgi:biotin-(acetyl-CoA carboxylase) ligase
MNNHIAKLKIEYLNNLLGFNQELNYIKNGESTKGVIVDISSNGQLIMEHDDEVVFYNFKEISLDYDGPQ